MPKPLLSIGMIVKNEIRCIERCLKALRPLRDAYPCELVIADTGSTDGTREVAERYADVLFDFPWIDDFAAARNAVLDRCSGQWFLMVDADEYLDEDLTGFRFLFRLKSKDWAELYGITQRNYASREFAHAPYSDFLMLRLGRVCREIRYKGAIHEALWKKAGKLKIGILPQIIFHHDGYAFQSAEEQNKKCERNLALLDKCLEDDPENKQRLIQCMESARVFPARMAQYAVRGMEILRRPGYIGDTMWDAYLATRCLEASIVSSLPQTEEWLHWCLERYPDAAIVRIDAIYAAIAWYSGKQQYQKIPALARAYLDAVAEVQAGKTPPLVRICTVFQHNTIETRHEVIIYLMMALLKLERPEEALSYVDRIPLKEVSAKTATNYLRVLAHMENLPKAAEEMARALPLLEPDGEDKWRKDRWRGILPLLRQFFQPGWGASEGAEHPWKLLLGCDGPLGQGARVMACTGAAEAEELLEQVEEWEDFPPQALLHALTLGARIPAGLRAQRTDLRLNLIAAMARGCPDFARHMADYPWGEAASLPVLQTQFDLVTCAAQCIGPLKAAGEAALCRRLCGKLAELSGELLPRLYHPELLANQADWLVLPGNHQFCLWLLEGERKRTAGDIPGYLRDLHQGLKQAPGMKDLTEFLLDEAEREAARAAASPELLALAEQVRGILEKFPPNDPAVAALKQSPAYQQVAPLIEGIDAPVFGGLTQ